MKKYIIINGKEAHLITASSMEKARHQAIKVCDHSKEVIVRELTSITIFGQSTLKNEFKQVQEDAKEIETV